MPTYSYSCKGCGDRRDLVMKIAEMTDFESQKWPCKCGGWFERDMSVGPATYQPFKEGFYEHISEGGAYISSAQELYDVAERNGQYAHQVEDGMGSRGVKRRRWI